MAAIVPNKDNNEPLELMSQISTFKFKKPVPTKPDPLVCFTPDFLNRLKEIERKTKIVTLKSGRHMCYFDESPAVANPSDLPIVLAIHGVGQGKELWMEAEPIPNIRLIAIDRMGNGGSSLQPVPYLFDEVINEIEEMLDKIDVDKFFVVGHSLGATFAMQVAAGLGETRVLGAAYISGQCDFYHQTAPKPHTKEWKGLTRSVMIANACAPGNNGCWARFVRYMFLYQLIGTMMYAERKDQDCGFADMYVANMRQAVENGGDGGCDLTWDAMDKDIFFVQKYLYATLHGCNAKSTSLVDLWRLHGKWHFDCGNFKGKCVIYHGENEQSLASCAEQSKRAIPQAELVWMLGHGHTTIMMEAPTIIQALIEGGVAKQVYC
mmetsp:Transcript_9649/g.12666  ORF Transcript_9649/g.12666 Transcript_9649/m.12666 type:complete len:378 (+) Transcript_9649:37-1170(+)|eukprot:CAMPEP_0114363604 /NCGR_PEP_ID=MMETSP0101-20121206/26738_1 /TAXON_ID=38822 ORGANISM="Pteridomonas danica, Strain PT" /NCGR_SAMPLE_ID=MMETSP0101 /ASSEMBLY_ACC=CAM_ASM_000211 /LENGTH=377 /DNA_ID=CAMNT_0001510423 /DNA_START=18 /DNA_END=1151 /DNA_ORIENTATION=-